MRLGTAGILGDYQERKRCNYLTSNLDSHFSQDTNHPFSFEDFKILSSSPFEYELFLHESLLISKLKSSLNANIGSAPLLLL